MQIPLPQPIPANTSYSGIVVERFAPNPDKQVWEAFIFGLIDGLAGPVPLVVMTAVGPKRIENLEIPFALIPSETPVSDLDSALVSAGMGVLSQILSEQPVAASE